MSVAIASGLPSHWNDPKLLVDENRRYIYDHLFQINDGINRKVCDYPLHPSETPFYDQINTGAVILDGVAGWRQDNDFAGSHWTLLEAGWRTLHLPSPTMFTEGGLSVRPSKVDVIDILIMRGYCTVFKKVVQASQ